MADASGRLNDDGTEAEPTEVAGWQEAHEALLKLAEHRAGLDFEEGRWLLSALRLGAHVRLGFGTFSEYAERIFGYGPRLTQDKLRVAEALEELPAMAEALRSGQTSWSAVRELTRVAIAGTEREWLEAARGRTVRDIERLVSGHRPGNRPGDDADPRAKRHILRLEVSSEALATFREAMAKIRRDAGEPLDDDAAVLMMARSVLGGPKDEGRSSYQIALSVCENCGEGKQHGRGELVEVGPEVLAMAECDAQHIGKVGTSAAHVGINGQTPPRAKQDVPPAVRRAVVRRDGGRCVVPGCRSATFLDLHHVETRADGGCHDANNLITACGAHHRAFHRGEVVVEGSVATGLEFRHADGSEYGRAVSPRTADTRAKAFQALRGMGFREGEVRRALEQVAHVDASLELVIRQSLLVLGKGTEARSGAKSR